MIGWDAPFALAGLVALPLLYLLHRRQRRPVPRIVPSVLFLRGEEPSAHAPERRRLDAEILLALAAAGLLAVAAASPYVTAGPRGRTVRVAIDAGPASLARTPAGTTVAERAERVLAELRAALGPGDRLDVVRVPTARLLGAARAGTASRRIVVTDRRLPEAGPDLHVVAVGAGSGPNAGLLAVEVLEDASGRRVFANVGNDAPEPRRLVVRAEPGGAHRELEVGAGGAASLELPLELAGGGALEHVTVTLEDEGGALGLDDLVHLDDAPVLVRFAPPPRGPPPALAAAVRGALDAVAPGRWREAGEGEATLQVGPLEGGERAQLVLLLHPVPPGVRAARRAPADPLAPADPRVGQDLDATGADLHYDPAVATGPPWPLAQAATSAGGGLVVDWFPDPTLGSPAPVDHPVWPLFVDNLLEVVRGRAGPRGWRVEGLLDPSVTFLGRDEAPLSPSVLATAQEDRRPRRQALTPWFLAGGALCLGLLWFTPRRRTARAVG